MRGGAGCQRALFRDGAGPAAGHPKSVHSVVSVRRDRAAAARRAAPRYRGYCVLPFALDVARRHGAGGVAGPARGMAAGQVGWCGARLACGLARGHGCGALQLKRRCRSGMSQPSSVMSPSIALNRVSAVSYRPHRAARPAAKQAAGLPGLPHPGRNRRDRCNRDRRLSAKRTRAGSCRHPNATTEPARNVTGPFDGYGFP